MNILLVYPSRLGANQKPLKYKKAFLPPLSLALLNGLTPASHNVHVVNDIVEDIDFSVAYDLVGITAMTTQIQRAYQIADAFRNRGVKVVIGGIHPTVLPDEAKQHADSVVIGEADNLWEQILSDCSRNTLKAFYKDDTSPDLKQLVLPKWDNINMNIYPKNIGAKLPLMPIYTTRGCPMGCQFCSVTKYFGKKYRMRPIANVLEEVKQVGSRIYFFVDDNIVCNPDYSRELFRSLKGKGIHWFSQISSTVLKNPDLIELASAAGCDSLLVGLESISESSLKSVNKGFNIVERYEELIARMKKARVIPFLTFIFGFDEDTPELFETTYEFLIRNRVPYAIFSILTPLPGTDIYNRLKNEGRILDHDWSKYELTNVVFQPKNFSKQELLDYYWNCSRKFYSIKNIIMNVYQSVKIAHNPFMELFESSFFQVYFRKRIYSYDHPISGGIDLIE